MGRAAESRRAVVGWLGAAVLAATPALARADLTIDLRITGAGPGVAIHSPKAAVPTAVGNTVTIGIFARVSGSNGVNDERFQDASGSLRSGFGDLLGNLLASNVAPFNAAGATPGVQSDFDSDGDFDIGGLGTEATGKFAARSFPSTLLTSIIDANTAEAQIGSVTFTVTSPFGPFTTVNWLRRNSNNEGEGIWFEDGGSVSVIASATNMHVGTPVFIGIPEPSAFAVAAVTAAIGLVARRSRSRRAS